MSVSVPQSGPKESPEVVEKSSLSTTQAPAWLVVGTLVLTAFCSCRLSKSILTWHTLESH